jgi:hypothetical protein
MLAPVVAGPCFVLLFALRDVIHQKGVKTFALSLFLRDKRIELPVQRAFRFEASRNLGARGVELLAGLLDSFAQRDRHRYSFAVGSPGRCSALRPIRSRGFELDSAIRVLCEPHLNEPGRFLRGALC